jgi:hypothetical protein
MYGGLKKSVSLVALVAAAGMMVTSANAADLGGDCCADLEERVAELEATTARKGNRRVSLTISGQVNRATMYFNDGFTNNVYFGLDNTNSSTRFGLSGSARVTPQVQAGFSIVIDVADKARTFSVTQGNEDIGAGGGLAPGSYSGFNGDHLIRLRDANWWLEHSAVGRLTVGRLTTAGAVAGIDLVGTQVVAGSSPGCVGSGLNFRNSAGGAIVASMSSFHDGCAYPTTRGEGVRYNSPAFAGFSFAASIAEAAKLETVNGGTTGRNLGAQLQYAGEFSGVRIAAGIGVERFEGNGDGVLLGPSNTTARTDNWGGSLALLHVPTGLFVQADYLSSDTRSTAYAVAGSERNATRWLVQAGIAQNWFGIGRTTLYGEYGQAKDWKFARNVSAVAGDDLTWWGIGAVQAIDAAAMELYLGYRNFDAETAPADALDQLHVVTAGARIRF